MKWFDEDVFANELDDFFAKRPTAYTKHDKSITENDLFQQKTIYNNNKI